MKDIIENLGWAALFMIVTAMIGTLLILAASLAIPKIVERLTPALDEEKEIARGNRAVAEYFGRVVSASIIAVGIVVSASILGGILFAVL